MIKRQHLLLFVAALLAALPRGAAAQEKATADNLVVNEVMAANIDQFMSPTVNFDGWVELYNPTIGYVSLAGIYLSDDPSQLLKWKAPADMGVIPPHGFVTIWFDNNALKNTNTNFKLDVGGGTLYISDTMGNLIVEQSYPEAVERTSYARTTDGGTEWRLTGYPTPSATNTTSTFADEELEAPHVSHDDQLFSGSLTIHVDIPEGCTLRYTRDGTLPTLTNGYSSSSGDFDIYNHAVMRFRLYKEGALPGKVATRSYIKRDKNYTGPILSVVSDPDFLYGDKIGVMVRGSGGKPGHGQDTKCNWNMDWERPVNFAFLPQDGQAVNRNVNLEMCGGWSRAWEPHSFKLKGNKEYGTKNLDYRFFPDKPYLRNRTLQIRNGGNDNYFRFKDPALETVIRLSGIDIDVQCYEPVHEFINGRYIGVLNMREPNNKHFVYANFGWDEEEIDLFEMDPDSSYIQKCGDAERFDRLYELTQTAAQPDSYEEIKELLDIEEYTNYMAMQLYLGGTDWPQNNVKGYARHDDGRYRFVSFDLDFAFNSNTPFVTFANKQNYTFDYCYDLKRRIRAEIKFVTIFLNLLKNDDFRRRFIDTFSLMGGSVFESSHYTPIIDSLLTRAREMMRLENIDPTQAANEIKNNLGSRLNTMTNALRSYSPMKLSGKTAQQVSLGSDVAHAHLYINGLRVPTGRFKGHLFAPMRIRAEAPAGYTFKGWKDQSGDMEQVIGYGSSWLYYDQGSLDAAAWTAEDYTTSQWKQGSAPLGYGKTGIKTTLSYGTSSNNKRPTYYFRHTAQLTEEPTASTTFKLKFTVDDGLVVYVNGTEAGRYNMPQGHVGYSTYATTYAPGNPDTGELTLPAHLFKKGTNTIAVEVHNNAATSTDIYWDAALETDLYAGDATFCSTDPEIDLPEGNVTLTACYEPMTAQERAAAGVHPVMINEVSADNSISVNDQWKRNDWVELVNTTDQDIDIEGMYLSDNEQKPQKWRISADGSDAPTVVPAHGHLIVWCDKLQPITELHADFKLDNDGGVVLLTAADGSWADLLPYPAHDGNSSVGRYPDGTGDIYLMQPTIKRENRLTVYDTLFMSAADGITAPTFAAKDALRMGYALGTLTVRGAVGDRCRIELYTLSGQRVRTLHAGVSHATATCPIDMPAGGCYIAKATDSEGRTCTCKFIVD